MNILTTLTETISAKFVERGYEASYGTVTVSSRPDLCHYQCNGALPAAKAYRKNPLVIAGEVAELLQGDARFSSIETAPPGFINLRLSDQYLAALAGDMAADERLLLPLMERKTIVVDYGGPNVAKPLHVGHLRSAIIGDALYRLARFLGHTVIGDIHMGDWGLQMGLVIAEMEGRGADAAAVSLDDLNEIYPAASARSKTDAAFAEKAAARTAALQHGDGDIRAVWKQIRDVSVSGLKRGYGALGVTFDRWYGESDAEPYVPRVKDILRERGLLRESDGALVVDVALPEDKEPMPPMLVEKSNGADVYGTTDLGTLLQRKEEFDPDEVWYVTDNRQAFHFRQVFRCAKLSGMLNSGEKEIQCLHFPFGTMNGKDGKPYKTRDGGVMRLSDLIGSVVENALRKVNESDVPMSGEERREAARMLGMAALRIGDMQNHRTKDYIFDMERFLASEGKTGPYLQYTAVRIRSVLAKARAAEIAAGEILPPATDAERDLLLSFPLVSDALLRAFADKAPSAVCDVLFDIAGRFNRFYFEHKILQCPDESLRASRLALLELTDRFLTILLELLGVEIPSHM
ncbi:MAG: arginine--tRNA ligase [Oscillospiraceae bacterium]|jgi:arginyl-tRNA synthetase|nr:arginine--tRNA ligase [Oscillospiraceae bacterium]